MDLSAILAYDKPLLIINYIALGCSFIWAYFRPEENTEWLVAGSVSYFFLMVASVFILAVPAFPCMVLWIPILLLMVKTFLEMQSGRAWAVPFILFVLSILQETAQGYMSGEEAGSLLLVWYFAGIFIVMMASQVLGAALDRAFPLLSERHLMIMRRIFGPGAPGKLVFRNGATATGGFTPGGCAAMGAIYSLWMILRFIILP